MSMTTEGKRRIGRLPLLLMGMACLVAGVWGGLVRLPLNLPLPGRGRAGAATRGILQFLRRKQQGDLAVVTVDAHSPGVFGAQLEDVPGDLATAKARGLL
jgi:hypothetical protein